MAVWRISARLQALAHVSSDGFRITTLPYARAGAAFHAGIDKGKFHGVIRPTTPTGERATSTSIDGLMDLMCSPPSRIASPAKNRNTCAALITSAVASRSVFPSSLES